MEDRTNEFLENEKYLNQLLVDVWENDFSTCEEISNLMKSIVENNLPGIASNMKELVLTAFKLGYNKGFEDGMKPQENEWNAKMKENSDKTLAIMEEVMAKLNIK